MIFECPGSRKFKHPYPEVVRCPFCGEEAEIWTDEAEVACDNCKKRITRKEGQSCLDWCSKAKECVGEELYKKHIAAKSISKIKNIKRR